MKKRIGSIVILLGIAYFVIILLFNYKNSIDLKAEGTFAIGIINEVTTGTKSSRYVNFNYYNNDKKELGYTSLQIWDEVPKVGDKYLVIFLKDKPYLNYIFLETKLSDDAEIEDDATIFIPKEVKINFLKL